MRAGIAPAATALGTRFRNSTTLSPARKRPVSRPPRRKERTRNSTRRLRRASPPFTASGADSRRMAPTGGSPTPAGAGLRPRSAKPRRIAGSGETAWAQATPARLVPRRRAAPTRTRPTRRRQKITADSCPRSPRARSATPRNSLHPASTKNRTSGERTGATGRKDNARPTTQAVMSSLARAIPRSEIVPATRARDAVPCRPRSAASARTTAITESRPKSPKSAAPSWRARSRVVKRPMRRARTSVPSLMALPLVASAAAEAGEEVTTSLARGGVKGGARRRAECIRAARVASIHTFARDRLGSSHACTSGRPDGRVDCGRGAARVAAPAGPLAPAPRARVQRGRASSLSSWP